MTNDPFYISPDDPPAKRRILQEGLRLFAQRGLSATSIRDIAAATGYSNPALYKHFKTKDALAVFLFERSYREILRQLSLATQQADGFEAKFSAYIVAFTTFFDTNPQAAVFTSDNLPTLWPHVSEHFQGRTIITLTREVLEQGKQEGLVSRDVRPPMQLVLVNGMISQLIRQMFFGELTGPASTFAPEIEGILRKALA